MSLRVRYIIFLALICCPVVDVISQDVGFSQFYGNPVFLNPALTGNKLCPRVTLNYRNQWPSIPASYVTYSVSFDQYVDAISGGVALMVVSDQAGDRMLINNTFSGVYSYRVDISRVIVLNAALQATYQQLALDWDKLVFGDQLISGGLTLEEKPQSLNKSFPDFSSGFVIGYRESYFLGFAAHHLTQPDNGFYRNSASKQQLKITAHAGAIFNLIPGAPFDDYFEVPSIAPNILYQQQGEFKQLNLGTYFNLHPMVVGVWFRHNFSNPDALMALIGFEHKQFKFGYSYDYTVSRLTNASGGAHEISFAWIFNCSNASVIRSETVRRGNIRAVECPSF
jgi:type IX secretion system PorP/SprF family membrane protein